MLSTHIVAMLRARMLPFFEDENPAEARLANAATIELLNCGYTVAPGSLGSASADSLRQVAEAARYIVGADRDITPIYADFPEGVQETSTFVLLVEQIAHYLTGGSFLPSRVPPVREGLPLEDALRNSPVVKVVTREDAKRDAHDMIGARLPMSEANRDLFGALFAYAYQGVSAEDVFDDVYRLVRDGAIKSDENFSHLLLAVRRLIDLAATFALSIYPGTTLDRTLRAYLVAYGDSVPGHEDAYANAVTYLRDSDAYSVRMIPAPREIRRRLLASVSASSKGEFGPDPLVARNSLWRRVMRSVHPYSVTHDDDARRALDVIHDNIEYRTFASGVEKALAEKDFQEALGLLSQRPNLLLRRITALCGIAESDADILALVSVLVDPNKRFSLTTLLSAYSGVANYNSSATRTVRVSGRANTQVERDVKPLSESAQAALKDALKTAVSNVLGSSPAPQGVVGLKGGEEKVSLMDRDLSSGNAIVRRGERRHPMGEGDTLRLFSYGKNNSTRSGYLDMGVMVFDAEGEVLAYGDWNSWNTVRSWMTYSGDCYIAPGRHATEFIDVDVQALRKKYPDAAYVGMTVTSYSDIPFPEWDALAGAMYRSDAQKGKTFDARSVTTAFQVSVKGNTLAAVAFDLDAGEMVWVDTGTGSSRANLSLVYHGQEYANAFADVLFAERLTYGEMASLWAQAHGVEVDEDAPIDREAILSLLS